MEWKRTLTNEEYWLIGLLALAYLGFWVRHWVVTRRMKAKGKNLWQKGLLRVTYVSLIFLAFLGPLVGTVEDVLKSNTRNIWFLLDVSQSMNAADVLPSRLDRARKFIKTISDAAASDKVGLIIFADSAYLQCPLTYDHEAFDLFLQTSNTGLILAQGTSVKNALNLLLSKSTEGAVRNDESNVGLLLSDGEDFGPLADAEIYRLKRLGYRLSVVGVGNADGVAIPALNGGGILKNEKGEKILTKLNEDGLRGVAAEAGGEYFSIAGKTDRPDEVVKWINAQKSSSILARKQSIGADKYHYPLTVALILIVIDVIFTLSTVSFKKK